MILNFILYLVVLILVGKGIDVFLGRAIRK
jgi:hypothetical protein